MTVVDPGRNIALRRFRFPADLGLGTGDGVTAAADGLVIGVPSGRTEHTDPHAGTTAGYEWATWTSPVVPVGFLIDEVVPSWTGDTPPGCWLRVQLRGWDGPGPTTDWYDLGHWAADESTIHRSSVPGQEGQDEAWAKVDTFGLLRSAATGWQIRVTLHRRAGLAVTPVLRTLGAVASAEADGHARPGDDPAGPDDDPGGPDDDPGGPDDDPGGPDDDAAGPGDDVAGPGGGPADGRGRVLAVPRYSQRRHAGGENRWGGGGDSWCSPTCVTMVLDFWAAGPTPDRYAWVDPPGHRPVVVHAARHCYDHAYAGAGNWPFNTAYAGGHGMDAFVTRLRHLGEAERFVAAGIPLVVSAAFRRGQVPGLDYDTRGHLMVLVGFTADGDPVLNDPYAPDDEAVRRTVPRRPFEAAWQGGSGGIAYVIRPERVPLPTPPAQANW